MASVLYFLHFNSTIQW